MVIKQLADIGIHVRPGNGEQRTTCPECSLVRRKKKDRCLAVRIDGDEAKWNCWHCGWTGWIAPERERRRVGKTGTKDAVAKVLSKHYRVRQSQKSFNHELGLPLAILNLGSLGS